MFEKFKRSSKSNNSSEEKNEAMKKDEGFKKHRRSFFGHREEQSYS